MDELNSINEDHISSCLSSSEDVYSNFENVTEVSITYTGETTKDIIVSVDNKEYKIYAELQKIRFDSLDELPQEGSEHLIYIVGDTLYLWNANRNSYDRLLGNYDKQIAELESKVNDKFAELDAKDLEQDNAIQGNADNIASVDKKVDEVNKTLNDKIDETTTSINEQISTINTKNDEQDKNISQLQSDVEINRQNIENNASDIQNIKDTYATKQYVTDYTYDKQTIDDAIDDLDTDFTDLNTRLTDAEAEIESNTADIESNRTLILDLQNKSGSTLEMSVDPTTYELTVNLKNQKGEIVSTGSIDLPIEEMVISASYKDGVLTLTLKNGQTIDVDISAIIGGLVNKQEFDDEVTRLDGEITTLQGEIAATDLTITAIEEANKDRDTKINGLRTTVSEHEQELADYEKRVKANEDNIASNTASIETLNSKTDTTNSNLSTLSDKVDGIEGHVATNTADIQSIKDDYATKQYVDENGGKIDSISVNGQAQTIDENKNVDISVPTSLAELSDDETHRVVTDEEKKYWNLKRTLVTGVGTRIPEGADLNNLEYLNPGVYYYDTINAEKPLINSPFGNDGILLPFILEVSEIIPDSLLAQDNQKIRSRHIYSSTAGLAGAYEWVDEVVISDDSQVLNLIGWQQIVTINSQGGIRAGANTNSAFGIFDNIVIGNNASAGYDGNSGISIGPSASSKSGVAIGYEAQTGDGGSIGRYAHSDGGGAVGYRATTNGGGAVGAWSVSGEGFAGGWEAVTKNGDIVIDAIQLGTGTNSVAKTLQVYDDNIYNATDHTLTVNNIQLNGSPLVAVTEQNKKDWDATRPTFEVTSKTLDDIGGEGTTYTIDKVNIMPITPTIRVSDQIIFGTQNATYWATVTQVDTNSIKARVEFSGATIGYVNQQTAAGGTDTVKYTEQSLSTAQQEQARTNIDAASNADLADKLSKKEVITPADGVQLGQSAYAYSTSVAIGKEVRAELDGVAIGWHASADKGGGAVGHNAQIAVDDSHYIAGGAVGYTACAGAGFSGGANAKAGFVGNGGGIGPKYIDCIQLGTGRNNTEKSLQIYDDNIYNADTHTLTVQNIELDGTPLGSLATKSTVAKTDLASDVQTSLNNADAAFPKAGGSITGNTTVGGTLSSYDTLAALTRYGNAFELKYDGNTGVEIGRKDGTKCSAYIDFHTDGNEKTDYNVRLLAMGSQLQITAFDGIKFGNWTISQNSSGNLVFS